MRRLTSYCLATVVLASWSGCCAGPERFYQNAYGFNNPEIEQYCPGPPPPVTTPPGYIVPAVTPEDETVPGIQEQQAPRDTRAQRPTRSNAQSEAAE
jgi:hypothetical protein